MSTEASTVIIDKLITDFVVSFIGFIVIAIFLGQGGKLFHESFSHWVMIFGLANVFTGIGGFIFNTLEYTLLKILLSLSIAFFGGWLDITFK
jgi:hypothetical protein